MPTKRKSDPLAGLRYLNDRCAVPRMGAALMALMLTGCVDGPNYKKPILKVNDSWNVNSPQISAQAATDSAWWKSFNDPTLEQLIQLAYNQNLTLQVAGLRIMEARAVLGIATGSQYPQNEVSASVSRVGLSKNTVNKPPDFTRDYWSQQLSFD